jgi:hypothetical protein
MDGDKYGSMLFWKVHPAMQLLDAAGATARLFALPTVPVSPPAAALCAPFFCQQLCSDKTGTLTLNKMVIQDDCPIYTPGITKEDVLKSAALAAKWKEPPRDALDTLVLLNSGLDLKELDQYEQVRIAALG